MAARRWFRFYAVGAAGVLAQSGGFNLLAVVLGWHYLVATAFAVEAAVLHNFFWHRWWTWADRGEAGALRQLVRFHLTTGVASVGGNLLLMRLLVGGLYLHPVIASLVTVAGCSVVNFVLSDQVVFRGAAFRLPGRDSSRPLCSGK